MSIRPLPPALAEKARVELNEDPKRLKDDLQNIKDGIAKQPHLNARTGPCDLTYHWQNYRTMLLGSDKSDASPIRMKGAHYLNTSTGFETIFNALKSLLNEKNKNNLYVHNKNYEDMYKYISKDIMPAEYGGNGGTLKEITEYWQNKVKEYSSWLEEDLKYGTDESKRPGAPRTSESMFGIEGSFRQLEFD